METSWTFTTRSSPSPHSRSRAGLTTWAWSPLQCPSVFSWCNTPSGRHIGGPNTPTAPGWLRHQSWIWFSSLHPFPFNTSRIAISTRCKRVNKNFALKQKKQVVTIRWELKNGLGFCLPSAGTSWKCQRLKMLCNVSVRTCWKMVATEKVLNINITNFVPLLHCSPSISVAFYGSHLCQVSSFRFHLQACCSFLQHPDCSGWVRQK